MGTPEAPGGREVDPGGGVDQQGAGRKAAPPICFASPAAQPANAAACVLIIDVNEKRSF